MNSKSCVIIGNGTLLIGCSEVLLSRGHQINAVVSHDAQIRDWAQAQGIKDLAKVEHLAETTTFDWLFSIANLQLLPEATLKLPSEGAVNFHDGPLPRHAGLNAPNWALIDGETRYGISWHLLERGVDEGDILAQNLFDLSDRETAFSLNSKCYAAGLESFSDVLGQIEAGALRRQKQDLSLRSYHRKQDRPEAAGVLDFDQPAEDISRLVRALDFGGYWNPLVCPKILAKGRVVLVSGAEAMQGTGTAGEVLSVSDGDMVVATRDGAIRLSGLLDAFGQKTRPQTMFTSGDQIAALPRAERDAIGRSLQNALKNEREVQSILRDAEPARAPLITKSGGTGVLSADIQIPDGLGAAALAAAMMAVAQNTEDRSASYIALSNPALSEFSGTGLLSNWYPLSARLDTPVAKLCSDLADTLENPDINSGWPCDLVARSPEITTFDHPQIALMLGQDAPLEGASLTLSYFGDRARLHADASAHTANAVDLIAARITHVLEQIESGASQGALREIDVIPPSEQALLLKGWNQTQTPYDVTTVHAAFEAQVAKTPDATALIFEGAELTYAALNARANAIAAELTEAGVKPGHPVGLYLHRSAELVIAALAILKAGGCYLPLDPSYPAARIAHYITDSDTKIILSDPTLEGSLPPHCARVLPVASRPADVMAANIDGGADPSDLAYLIYTSGSTGTPKGVMVRHDNVANFFVGMDQRIPHKAGDTWLAVTSLNFDISVLEIFWTLSRGFRLVFSSDESRLNLSTPDQQEAGKGMDFNLFYWGNDDGAGPRKYELLIEGAKFADAHGFNAVWTPERHFHAFGGLYPNPAITGAAVAAVTQNLGVRAGSCVAPLHHPARIAEEWAVIDNLTNGRAALGIASGWQPDDFILRPENTPPNNKPAMFETIETLRRLWRGEEVDFARADGTLHSVVTQPRPVSSELPLWVTTAGNPETWKEAGKIGANVLTHLLGQSISEVADKITIYHQSLREAGFDPAYFTVTLMLHTYLAKTRDSARDIAREPMKDYLRSAAGLIKQYAWAFPAFKKPKGVKSPFEMDLGSLSQDELEAILDFAFERYFEDSGLFGTIDDAVARVNALKEIGVGEIACLIDYGIAPEIVLEGLRPLAEVLRRSNAPQPKTEDYSLAGLIRTYGATHMQCTPSLARLIAEDASALGAVGSLQHLLLGGEALPRDLIGRLQQSGDVQIHNMYGPTETTIWSTTQKITDLPDGVASLGTPIANTSVYVLDDQGAFAPVGAEGELFIGGDGVTSGYWRRADLTAERFPIDPFAQESARMYRTGDLVRWRSDGHLEFLGRTDHQVKIRGQRIELGEIETALATHSDVSGAVVVQHGDALAAYVTGTEQLNSKALRTHAAQHLTPAMTPAHFCILDAFPMTPNKKIDRNALPDPIETTAPPVAETKAVPQGLTARIGRIWAGTLGISEVQPADNFFELGGHSLLAVQMHRELRETLGLPKLSITDIFRFPVLRDLAAHADRISGDSAPQNTHEPENHNADRSQIMSRRRTMRANRQQARRA